jgi:hypothetical protein
MTAIGAGSASSGAAQGGARGEAAAGSAAAPAVLEWSVSPWRERPWAAAGAMAGALGLWWLALALLPGARLTATLLGLLCLGVLAPGLGVTRCRLDADGVGRRGVLGWERRRWDQVRRARTGRAGLFVSPFDRPHPLDRFRGLFLPLPSRGGDPAALRDALAAEVRRRGL